MYIKNKQPLSNFLKLFDHFLSNLPRTEKEVLLIKKIRVGTYVSVRYNWKFCFQKFKYWRVKPFYKHFSFLLMLIC